MHVEVLPDMKYMLIQYSPESLLCQNGLPRFSEFLLVYLPNKQNPHLLLYTFSGSISIYQ